MTLEKAIRETSVNVARRIPGRRKGSHETADHPASEQAQPVEPALAYPAGPLAGRHVLLVAGRSTEAEGPGVNALAVHVEQAAGRVSILPSASAIADLLGRRVVGRPDLVVAVLPGRGSSMAAVRVAERLGTPLLAVVNSDEAPSWGEVGTLRRATRVAVTSERLRERVAAAGVAREKVELWNALLPTAFAAFDQIAGRTLRPAATATR